MKVSFIKIFDRISNIGINETQDFYDQLKFKVFNQTLTVIVLVLLVMIISDIIEKNETIVFTILALLFMLFIFLLQYHRRQLLASLIFSSLFPFLLFILTIFYGEEMNINYVYFAFIIITLLAFESLWLKVSFSVFILLLQATGIYYNRYYGSLIQKDIPLLDGILILILPTFGVGVLILTQVDTIKKLYLIQKKINRELESKNKELTKLVKQNEAKNNLLAIIAHDLKGPASSFNDLTKNIAYLLKKEQPEKIEQMANNFETAGSKLYYTISNLLNWVTSQRGDIVSHERKFNLVSLLKEVIDSLSFQNQYKNVKFKYVPEELPELTTDREMLKIILFNILNNAIKFSKPNDEIIVKFSKDLKFNIIKVIDFGSGIEDEVIEKILSKEIVTTRRTLYEKGHGIGLKNCFILIQHLGGKITIKSGVGKGTTFGICIPKVEVD